MTAPFGVELHSPIERLEIVSELGEAKFIVAPPTPHPRLGTYLVRATQATGVVWVKGLSYDIQNDAYGYQARTIQEELESQLARRYGDGHTTDQLSYGSIWNEPRDWLQSLAYNERVFYTTWRRPSASLPEDLDSIFLGISATDPYTSYVSLEYESINGRAADAEVHQMLSDLL